MAEPSRAVFLSYASQDVAAARRICDSLRSAGIEVWLDQSELRGGEAWDAAIRRQIKACALFVPIISSNTHAREEGYFRLEWKLAIDRSYLMTASRAFLVPVVIDDTRDDDEQVPDRFRELQWSRLPGGDTTPAFTTRVLQLLSSGEPAAVVPGGRTHDAPAARAPLRRARSAWRSKPVWLAVAAAAALTLGYAALDRWRSPGRGTDAARVPPPTAEQVAATQGASPPGAIPDKSIAVLPFVDMSEKKDQEYFSDGLTEELLDLLAQVPGLRVPARTSSFYFKGKAEDIGVIARKLRVAHVLEGSVRKSGSTLRVTAQLIRADNGYHLWSKAYDRDVTDVFKVQDEIAAAVVEALKAQLLPLPQAAGRHRTASTEAYTQYLLGNQFRLRDTPDSNRQALAAYQKAIALDPGYAAAYSGLSDAEWRNADQSTGEEAGYRRAIAAADQAIALAPDSPDGYWARGGLRFYYFFDWSSARADFEKALALDPNDVRTQVDYSDLVQTLGRTPEAIAFLRRAVALDPLSVRAWRRMAWVLLNSGQFDAAREAIGRVYEINPDGDPGGVLVDIELLAGRPQQALAESRKRIGTAFTGYGLVGTAMAEHTLGHAAESQRALDVLIRDHGKVWAYQIAEAYAWRGEPDKTFEWLERAYRQHDGGLIYLRNDRFLLGLRGDPRYRALLRKMKLPEPGA